MKIGPKPPSGHHHGRVHSHKPQKEIRSKKIDQMTPEVEVDDVDQMAPLEMRSETGGQGSQQQSNQQQSSAGLDKPLLTEITTAEPQLQALVHALCEQLTELAEAMELAGDHAMPQLKHAQTTTGLKDILRQVASGDFGMQMTKDPNIGMGKLLSGVKKWPKSIPPGRKPPWAEEDWDTFFSWLYAPPPLPPDDELL